MLECAAGFLAGRTIADRPGTWFVVYRALPGSAGIAVPGVTG
jgi:hypothetical protein